MYSVVMLAAMTATPQTPEWCCFTKCFQPCCPPPIVYCPPPCCPPPVVYCPPPPCYTPCCGTEVILPPAHHHGEHPHHEGHEPKGPHPKEKGPHPKEMPKKGPPKKDLPDSKVSMLPSNQGQMLVQVPASATVYAEGQLVAGNGSLRTLTTPVIAEGADFTYTLKVEYSVNGETRIASKQVIVRAGLITPVDFSTLLTDKTTSAVSVNLPSKSKLFIDGVEISVKTGVAHFNTAPLTTGEQLSYTISTETPRDGRIEVETRKVSFKAGEPVEIDFTRKSAESVVSVK